MQNKENQSKWARLNHAYSTGKFSHVLEQFYLTQLNLRGACLCVCVYIDTQVYTVSQVPQLGIKEYCVNILRKVTKKWIQLLLLQTIIVWCRAAHWLKIYWSRKTCKVWSWKMSLWLFSPYQLTWHQDTVTKVKWKDCSQLCAIPSLRLRVDQLWIQDKASPNFATLMMKKCNSAIITQKAVSKSSHSPVPHLCPSL